MSYDTVAKDWKAVTDKGLKYFFNFLITLVVCITSIVIVYLILFAFTSRGQKAFGMQESRLANQLTVILNEASRISASNLDAEQRLKIAQAIIEQYDPATDSLNPILNENAKPGTSMLEILSHFKINKNGKTVELIKELDTSKGKTQWE